MDEDLESGQKKTGPKKSGLDRRTLIKRAAVAGAVAWTAPAIIGSVTSPAGALTAPSGCFRFKFNADPDSHGGDTCQVVTYANDNCQPDASSLCSPQAVTTLSDGANLSTYCITQNLGSPGSCNRTGTATFTIDPACACTFLGGNFLASAFICGTECRTGTIGAGGKSITFTLPGACIGFIPFRWEQARLAFRCG